GPRRPALERDDDRVGGLRGDRLRSRRHPDDERDPHAFAHERAGKIRGAGEVVGDAAEEGSGHRVKGSGAAREAIGRAWQGHPADALPPRLLLSSAREWGAFGFSSVATW